MFSNNQSPFLFLALTHLSSWNEMLWILFFIPLYAARSYRLKHPSNPQLNTSVYLLVAAELRSPRCLFKIERFTNTVTFCSETLRKPFAKRHAPRATRSLGCFYFHFDGRVSFKSRDPCLDYNSLHVRVFYTSIMGCGCLIGLKKKQRLL